MPVPPDDLREWRQGDVFDLGGFDYTDLASGGDSEVTLKTRPDVRLVLLTQTCDIVRPSDKRPDVIASPLVELSSVTLAGAQKGASPRYVNVPAIGTAWFADLDSAMTLTKRVLLTRKRTPGLRSNRERRAFKHAVGRKFTRVALPNHIDAALKPLQNIMRSKHNKTGSAEGRRLGDLQEIRIEVDPDDDWFTDPVEITLVFIVKAGELPLRPSVTPSEKLRDWFDARDRQRHEIAEEIERVGSDDDRMWLWQKLADRWADHSATKGLVVSIHGEAIPAEKYGLDRMKRSEELDLDYLSNDGS